MRYHITKASNQPRLKIAGDEFAPLAFGLLAGFVVGAVATIAIAIIKWY